MTWWLTWVTSRFLLRSCRWGELLETQNLALEAAARTPARTGSSAAARGWSTDQKDYTKAMQHARKTQRLYRAAGDASREAIASNLSRAQRICQEEIRTKLTQLPVRP